MKTDSSKREYLDHQVTARVDTIMLYKIDRAADKAGVTRAEIVRRALEKYLK